MKEYIGRMVATKWAKQIGIVKSLLGGGYVSVEWFPREGGSPLRQSAEHRHTLPVLFEMFEQLREHGGDWDKVTYKKGI